MASDEDYLESHPVRVRGLKSEPPAPDQVGDLVAPRAGAWIEITRGLAVVHIRLRSHPVRVRGLKYQPANPSIRGARASHPVRVRGLKLYSYSQADRLHRSHPVRVRGLKCTVL